MARFSTDALVIDTDGMANPLRLRGVGSASHSLGIATVGPDSGNTYDEVKFIGAQDVTMPFTVLAIEAILKEVGLLTGLCVLADVAKPGVEMFGQAHDPCGVKGRTAGATNLKVTADVAHIFVTGISGGRGESAVATLDIIALANGTTQPTAVVYNATLPAGLLFDEEFIVGQPTIAGVELAADSVQSWSIDTGIEYTQLSAIDEIWNTAVDITKVRPRITIQTDDPSILDAAKIPYQGAACTHADTTFWLVKRAPSSGLFPKTATEHIKITASGIAYVSQQYNATGSGTATTEIVIETTEAGGSAPLVVSTNQFITPPS